LSKKIPRRLRRFHRDEDQLEYQKPTEEEVKSKGRDIALKEVDSFKERNERYPSSKELDEISESVFRQLKNEMKEGKVLSENIYSGLLQPEEAPEEEPKGKSFLEKRRDRRRGRHGEKTEKETQLTQEEKPAELKTRRGQKLSKENLKESGIAPKPLEEKEEIALPKELTEQDSENEIEEMPSLSEDEDIKEIETESEIRELAAVDELSDLESDLGTDDDIDLIEKEVADPKANVCPNCNNSSSNLVYCPSCGQAFCDHCAKGVEVGTETIKYTCPKCSYAFKKKKP